MDIIKISVKEQVLLAMQRVYENALTSTSGGNISAMDENGHIFITPSSIDKGSLTIDDIVEVLPNGEIIGKHKPSMELPFHSNIYKTCKDVKAIVHAHAPAAVAYACMRICPDPNCARVYLDNLGEIAGSKYALPGSLKLGDIVMERFKQGYRTVMMDNHGATVGAKDMATAFAKYENLDYLCRTLFNATAIGSAKNVTEIPLKVGEYAVKKFDASDDKTREEMVRFLKRAYKGGLVASSFGTLAVRVEGGFLFNAEGDSPLDMEKDDIAVFKDGFLSTNKPCKYLDLIRKIFEACEEVNALFISMPSATMAFAVANEDFDARLIPESYIMLKDVNRLSYDAVQDYDLIANTLSTKAPALIIDNECVITIGKNVTKAFDRLEVLDYSARSVLLAKAVSNIQPINNEQVDEINDTFNGW